VRSDAYSKHMWWVTSLSICIIRSALSRQHRQILSSITMHATKNIIGEYPQFVMENPFHIRHFGSETPTYIVLNAASCFEVDWAWRDQV